MIRVSAYLNQLVVNLKRRISEALMSQHSKAMDEPLLPQSEVPLPDLTFLRT
jgi:hypothetical protein